MIKFWISTILNMVILLGGIYLGWETRGVYETNPILKMVVKP